MYSSAGERASREELRSFEQVRIFFNELIPTQEEHPIPTRLVVFGSLKEYEPYKPNEVAIAYFTPGAERDTIVVGHIGLEAMPTAVHEYTHLVLEHGHLNAPPWLNEGLAEIFSTMRPNGGKVMIGEPIKGRLYEMLNSKWAPLATLLDADYNSPYYNEKNRAGSLYNEGWALTHMLMFEKAYSPKFDELLRVLSGGTPSLEAIPQVFGVSVAELDKALQSYIHRDSFYARLYPTKLEKITDTLPAEPAPDFDVKLIETELLTRPGKEEAARRSLEQLIAQDPKRPEPFAQMGYLEWRENNPTEAQKQFEKAFSLGDRSRRMLWDLGCMATYENPKVAINSLTELKTQEPRRGEVRVQLAMAQVRNRQAGSAMGTLNEMAAAKLLTQSDAPRFFIASTYAYIDLKQLEGAKASLKRLNEFAKEERDKSEAQYLPGYIDRLEQYNRRARASGGRVPAASGGVAEMRPVLVRPPSSVVSDPSKTQVFAEKPSVEGTFAEFVCGAEPKVVLKTAAETKTFIIEDPKRIVVMGKDGGKAELSCGAQQPIPMRIQYEPAPPGSEFEGYVRVLYFL